jgi:hypothetical protein
MGGSAKKTTTITSSECGNRWHARSVSVLHMPERISNTIGNTGELRTCSGPCHQVYHCLFNSNIYFSGRWSTCQVFLHTVKTQGFLIGGSTAIIFYHFSLAFIIYGDIRMDHLVSSTVWHSVLLDRSCLAGMSMRKLFSWLLFLSGEFL